MSISQQIDAVIQALCEKYPNTEKVFTAEKPPQNLSVKALKKFKTYHPQKETIKLGMISVILGFINLGILITDHAIHYRLQRGFMGLIKSGSIALDNITHLHAEHQSYHPCYKGGNPGPAFWVNNTEIGWTQILMVMSDDDEALLIDLFNQLDPSRNLKP